jgi:predicted nucleic acid-binding Zn ribbon protein
MECPQCKADREPKDFLQGKTLCYKCIYREKVKSLPRTKKDRSCALCNEIVPNNRLIYCSDKCKDEADRKRSYEKYHAKKERILMEGSDE